jgi:hypothetical protein
MISCIASDPANRTHYRAALDADDTVKSYRFLQYMLETEQMQNFGRWEEQKRTEAVRMPAAETYQRELTPVKAQSKLPNSSRRSLHKGTHTTKPG